MPSYQDLPQRERFDAVPPIRVSRVFCEAEPVSNISECIMDKGIPLGVPLGVFESTRDFGYVDSLRFFCLL